MCLLPQSDSVAVKQVDDKTNDVFAFELSPLPACVAQCSTLVREGEREREGEGEGEGEQQAAVSGRKHGKESDSDTEGLPTKMFKGEEQASSRDDHFSPVPVIITPNEPAVTLTDTGNSPVEGDNPVISQPSTPPQAVVMEWHSCAICLEEMVDSGLVTHGSCGAVLCPSCLQSSVHHYQKDGLVPCPVRYCLCWSVYCVVDMMVQSHSCCAA